MKARPQFRPIHYMSGIAANLQAVRARIATAERKAGRPAGSVRLLAVSKTCPAEAIMAAHGAGQTAFGENYAQEGSDKIAALQAGQIAAQLEWHFIGPLQSNKTRSIAEHFHWVHGIEREKIAERLNTQRDVWLPPLQVCIQVNVSGEASKSGVAPEQALALAQSIKRLPRLQLRGLMCIPEASSDTAVQHARFASLRSLRDELAGALGCELDTLSMGMSDDLEIAIAEGSTLVRVGSAIFGARG